MSATGRDILRQKKSHGKKSHKKPAKTMGGPTDKGGDFYNDVRDPISKKKGTTVAGSKGRFWVFIV